MSSEIGTVLEVLGGTYHVETPGGVREATLRGRIKQIEGTDGKVVAGDRVRLEPSVAGGVTAWTITGAEERHSELVRQAPGKAPRGKPVLANVDQVAVVFAAAHPDPHLRMLDRFLALCEASDLPAVVVINKLDLVDLDETRARFAPYEKAGYPLLLTSVKLDLGIAELRERLCGKLSGLTGPSGVGKSSLLNAVEPGLGLRIGAVSQAVGKGRHTTVTARLIPLGCGGYVADTPGLREIGLWGVDLEQLDHCFPDFAPFLDHCRFTGSCTHTHEPGCAIKAAVAEGRLDAGRYESYRRLRVGEEEGG
jgi:ribosome biogenesis GTPase / thiamine phosphate phosphatase